uniref:Receptor-type adenylate cyclase n=1 Tax=Lygus hesperus TaxID=30085 RepID=A0A0A9WRB1_LYGHE
MADNPEYISPTLVIDPLQYAARWNGLRVRIGMHTGLCKIKFSDELNGFDYTGETVQIAARMTSIANGGQTLMNEATWYALSFEERERFDYNNLESRRVNGLRVPLEIYQLNAIPGREFPPLRLEETECALQALFQDDNGDALKSGQDEKETLAQQTVMSSILSDCFSIFPATRRVREVMPLAEKWHISCPPTPIDREDEAQETYFNNLIQQLVRKVLTVRRRRNQGGMGLIKGNTYTDVNNNSRRPSQHEPAVNPLAHIPLYNAPVYETDL